MLCRLSLTLAACALLGISLIARLQAQEPAKESPAPSAEQIAQWVRDLDSDSFLAREEAQRKLVRLGERALSPLHEAMKAPPSLEFQCRAEKILSQLAIFEPGGPVAGDLKIRLTVDKTTPKIGDTVVFTTTLANMGERPINLEVGYTYCGIYFECGSLFMRRTTDGKDEASKCLAGFCGTGAKPMLATIPTRSVVEYRMPAKVAQRDGNTVLTLGPADYFMQTLEAQHGTTFRVVIQRQKQSYHGPFGGKYTPEPPANPDAAYWVGVARSNEVVLKVAR